MRPSVLRLAALIGSVALGTFAASDGQAPASLRPPNFIVILTDDQGYGDLGSYGHLDSADDLVYPPPNLPVP